ncbi:MAG: hypothetical protein ACFBSE_02245 [Prochloraceae cyanobacterium]
MRPRSIELLEKTAQEDPDESVRQFAQRALDERIELPTNKD